MKIDMHIHTNRYSACSSINPFALIEKAKQVGLDGIVITEHNIMWSEKEQRRLITESDGLRIFFGIEITASSRDHYLVYMEGEGDIYEHMDEDALISTVHKCGGVVVAAHPFRFNKHFHEKFQKYYPIDGIEIKSSNINEKGMEKAIELSASKDICQIAGSDAHHLDDVGRYYTLFEDHISSISDIIDAIREKRCSIGDVIYREDDKTFLDSLYGQIRKIL